MLKLVRVPTCRDLHRGGRGFESPSVHIMKCFVYIIYNIDHDKFYVGQTYSLKKRIFEHKNSLGNYTSRYGTNWSLLYFEVCEDRKVAMTREKYFKSLKSKIALKNFIKNNAKVG